MTTKSEFVQNWKKEFDSKKFDLKNMEDKEQFLKSIKDLVEHVAHTARQVQVFAIPKEEEILSTIFLKIESF